MREVESRLPGSRFVMVPVGLVDGHPEKPAVTLKVANAHTSCCFLLHNRIEREPHRRRLHALARSLACVYSHA